MEYPKDTTVTFGRLTAQHDTSTFDCGNHALNRYIRKHAESNQDNDLSTTYVAALGNRVVGYVTLTLVGVAPIDAPEALAKGVPGYGMPALLLARLAVHKDEHGTGLGRELFFLAARAAVAQSDRSQEDEDVPAAPVRVLLVHAKDDTAAAFYAHMGMDPSPTDHHHLMAAVKDLRVTLDEASKPAD